MPHRGRDTYYLEMMLGVIGLSTGLICCMIRPLFGETTALQLFESIMPVEAWCIAWTFSGGFLLWGSYHRHRTIIEWASFCMAFFWLLVAYNALQDYRRYPLTVATSPIFCVFNGIIAFYQMRVAQLRERGRITQTRWQ